MLTQAQLDTITGQLRQAAETMRQTDAKPLGSLLIAIEQFGATLPEDIPDTEMGRYDSGIISGFGAVHLQLLELNANLVAAPLLCERGQALSFARRVLLVQGLDGDLTNTYSLIRQRPAESQLILPGTTPLPHADAPVIAAGAVASAPASSAHSAPAAD